MASTYGRGVFAIRLSPDVLGNTPLQPNLLTIDPSTGVGTSNGLPLTSNTQPIIDGQSEQSAFGNTVTVNLYDHAADPNHLFPIGTGTTDANGNFKIQINAGVYKSDGSNDGLHVIDVQATDKSLARGNVASLSFILATQKPLPPTSISLDPSTDTGTLNNDGYTADNNSTSHPAAV